MNNNGLNPSSLHAAASRVQLMSHRHGGSLADRGQFFTVEDIAARRLSIREPSRCLMDPVGRFAHAATL